MSARQADLDRLSRYVETYERDKRADRLLSAVYGATERLAYLVPERHVEETEGLLLRQIEDAAEQLAEAAR